MAQSGVQKSTEITLTEKIFVAYQSTTAIPYLHHSILSLYPHFNSFAHQPLPSGGYLERESLRQEHSEFPFASHLWRF